MDGNNKLNFKRGGDQKGDQMALVPIRFIWHRFHFDTDSQINLAVKLLQLNFWALIGNSSNVITSGWDGTPERTATPIR